ncbi:MAG: helix-turn-helix domain-containing protein [Candidatus Altiarchaeota archaeon]|nr:helix-turn-helix domain-containing protein [Candidatus Altiarchaeota archaeon]
MNAQNTAETDILAKNIAGEITLAKNPGNAMKKWRQIFGINQRDVAKTLRISPSVISDYESGRRRTPGVEFVKKYTFAVMSLEKLEGGLSEKLASPKTTDAVIDLREFLTPIPAKTLIETVKGTVITKKEVAGVKVWGYTIIDSIKAILELTEEDFPQIYGTNTKRALIFTKVHMGRSPMIAIKVTKPKPCMVVFHGLKPREVDRLAIRIAEMEGIPLVVSNTRDEGELVERLRKINE